MRSAWARIGISAGGLSIGGVRPFGKACAAAACILRDGALKPASPASELFNRCRRYMHYPRLRRIIHARIFPARPSLGPGDVGKEGGGSVWLRRVTQHRAGIVE